MGWYADCTSRRTLGKELMSHFTAPLDRRIKIGSLTPPEINVLLFYHLGQFIVWGQQHPDLAAEDPDLAALLQRAAVALMRGGILEPAASVLSETGTTSRVPDSQNVVLPGSVASLKRRSATRGGSKVRRAGQ